MAFFFSVIFGTYAYAFFMGSVWIYNDIWNTTYHRFYRAGEIITCFFGVVFGMFSIGMATPNMKAVIEGRTAGKMAFDIIDRKPTIDQDDASAEEIKDLKGSIEFKNVSFYYPSRPDT
jgi:ABC-type multidrug transport system fused ATPase/permease subunit